MRSPPALVATIPPTVAESRAARSTPKASPAPAAAASTAASVAPAPAVTWPAATSTASIEDSRRRLSTTSPCRGTPPPTRPVLPPWGTTGRPAVDSAAMTAAASSVLPGRTTAAARPAKRPVQSVSNDAVSSGSVSTWWGPTTSVRAAISASTVGPLWLPGRHDAERPIAESPRGPQGRRHGDAPGRAAHRHAARRLRRRRGEGRAPEGRRPAGLRLGQGRRVAVVALRQPQQGVRDAQPQPAGRGRAVEGAGGRRRRPHRELPARHDGALGSRLGRAVGHQPPPRDGPGDGLRPDRPVLRPARLRHAGRVDERIRPPQRLSGRAADAPAPGAGRRRGGLCRRLLHPGRPAPP